MDPATVMELFAVRARTVATLAQHTYGYPADRIAAPACVVGYPEINFDLSGRRGKDAMTLPVWVALGRVSDRTSRDKISAFIAGSGTSSMKAALETPAPGETAGVIDTARVSRAAPDTYTVNSVDYLAYRFDVDITGKGA